MAGKLSQRDKIIQPSVGAAATLGKAWKIKCYSEGVEAVRGERDVTQKELMVLSLTLIQAEGHLNIIER